MSASSLRGAVLAAADALEAARDDLCRLDAVAGDGDHGVTVALGARAVRRALADDPEADGADLLAKIAVAAGGVGGAIGPIWATGLLRAANALRSVELAPAPAVSRLALCAQAAADGVGALGGARPGDKTVVDALLPFVDALQEAAERWEEPGQALTEAAAAARRGADSTASMVATLGRASRLGERSRGWPDPGATSFALVVEAVAEAFAAGQEQ